MRNVRGLRLAALFLAAILLLTACSGSKPAAEPAAGKNAEPAPVKLVVAAPLDVFTWDPHNNNFSYTMAVQQHVFDQLVYQNLETGKFDPGLATEWKLENPTTWAFTLRSGVKFQNGDPFTAADVKFNLERVAKDAKLRMNSTFRTIKEVQIVDDTHVKVITSAPDPILLNRLSSLGSAIVPAKYFESVGVDGFQKAPIGTGPYKVKEWKKDAYLDLAAWDGGWRGKPKVDEIRFRVIPEESTRVAELQSGGVDIALDLLAETAKNLKSDTQIEVKTAPTSYVILLNLRHTKGSITANPKVREAIELAIDKQALIDSVYPGMGIPTQTRITPGLIGHPAKYYNVNKPDVERAKQLLKEAGYPNGFELRFLSQNTDGFSDAAQTIAGMLEKIGIKVKLDLLDPVAFQEKFDTNTNPDLSLHANSNTLHDTDQVAYRFLPPRAAKKWDWDNPAVTDLVNKAAKEMDENARAALYQQMSDLVAADRPQIYLLHEKAAHGIRKGVNWAPRSDEMFRFGDVTKSSK